MSLSASTLTQVIPNPRILGNSPLMQEVVQLCRKAASTEACVLINGETGTGKTLAASFIHQNSRRKDRRFVALNCASIPDTLLESELYGYERGAFTGAEFSKPGRFELADGGTLFLDEIAELTPMAQANLLRTVQEKAFWRLGDTRERTADVRLVTATNKDLPSRVREKRFRDDLFFRINVLQISFPALRDRRSDIPALAYYYLKIFANEIGQDRRGFTQGALLKLRSYDWPGNVRELMNVIQRAVVLARDEHEIGEQDLYFGERIVQEEGPIVRIPPGGIALDTINRIAIVEALKMTDGSQQDAAELLSVTTRVLKYNVKKYAISSADGVNTRSWRRLGNAEQPVG